MNIDFPLIVAGCKSCESNQDLVVDKYASFKEEDKAEILWLDSNEEFETDGKKHVFVALGMERGKYSSFFEIERSELRGKHEVNESDSSKEIVGHEDSNFFSHMDQRRYRN